MADKSQTLLFPKPVDPMKNKKCVWCENQAFQTDKNSEFVCVGCMRYTAGELIDLIDKGLMGKKCQELLKIRRAKILEYVEKCSDKRMNEFEKGLVSE